MAISSAKGKEEKGRRGVTSCCEIKSGGFEIKDGINELSRNMDKDFALCSINKSRQICMRPHLSKLGANELYSDSRRLEWKMNGTQDRRERKAFVIYKINESSQDFVSSLSPLLSLYMCKNKRTYNNRTKLGMYNHYYQSLNDHAHPQEISNIKKIITTREHQAAAQRC